MVCNVLTVRDLKNGRYLVMEDVGLYILFSGDYKITVTNIFTLAIVVISRFVFFFVHFKIYG